MIARVPNVLLPHALRATPRYWSPFRPAFSLLPDLGWASPTASDEDRPKVTRLQSCSARAVEGCCRHCWSCHPLPHSAAVMTNGVPCMNVSITAPRPFACDPLSHAPESCLLPSPSISLMIASMRHKIFRLQGRVDCAHQIDPIFLLQRRVPMHFVDALQFVRIIRFPAFRR